MIFATVGTHQQPFVRLLEALSRLDRTDIVVQHGHGRAPENVELARAFVSFAQMTSYMEEAETVITHAGVGSILLARSHGHTPIVMPRLHRHGEHVDDHQSDLTAALAPRGEIVVATDAAELARAIADPAPRRPATATPAGPLHDAVRAALLG